MVSFFLDKGQTVKQAAQSAIQRLDGTWGLAMLSAEAPDQIIVARNGSNAVIGIGKDEMYVRWSMCVGRCALVDVRGSMRVEPG
jgi:glucosamine 6-phosphate synthetase-like amidotransferase/phosphosugar isomerase protein